MFQKYFKTAFRSLIRNKNYTAINIAGLAVGIAVCTIIFVIVQFHQSFDNYHKKKDRIYRVLTEYHHADAPDIFYGKGVPTGLPAAVKNNFPQVEKVARVYTEGNDQLLVLNDSGQPEKKFKEEQGVFFAQPEFFDVFDFNWLAGSPSSLNNPNNVVLTQATAERYFGDWKSAVGKTLKWKNSEVIKVAGILDDPPANTDLPVKMVIALGTGYTADILKSTEWDGTGSDFGCYLLLAPTASETAFNAQLRDLSKKMKSADNKDSQIIQPLKDVHYDTQAGTIGGKTFSRELINALWMIAAFILLVACVNFINLSTAQAINRSKEVGVRKVLGSNKRQLKLQFLSETFLIVLFSVLLSLMIVLMVLPFVGSILDLPLSLNVASNPSIVAFLLVLTIVVTVLAGFYPSIVLSSFNPINALKNKIVSRSTKGISLRRGLVVFQFIIAQALIIGTLIIVKQMNYFTSQPLGFNKDAVVNIPFPGGDAGTSKLNQLRNELAGIKGVERITFSTNTPIEDNSDNWSTFRFDKAPKETDFYAIIKFSDAEYLPTYELPLAAGRNIQPSDTIKEFLVNEMLVKNLGFKNAQEALNKEISIWNDEYRGNIVGVIKDFNNRSFRAPVAPMLMGSQKSFYNVAGIKLAYTDASAALPMIEKVWSSIFPDFVFEYQFLDDKVESFYKKEHQLSQLYKIFAAIAIFLSCLGLYGLASFMAVQRIKEVGIRKVLGASVQSIVILFSKEFVILISIAFAIATPIAWYYMQQWLQDYPFKIDMSWWIFLIGGIASILIALVTVSFQAIRAAVANPVRSLRTE